MDSVDYDVLPDDFFSCSSSSDSFISMDSGDGCSSIDHLFRVLSRNCKNFNVVHINAQSIPRHYADILTTFSGSPVDAILVSESWLKPSLSSTSYALPGYKLIRNDRVGKGGGGVAIYLRGDIECNVVSTSPNDYSGSAEHLFVEVTLHHKKVLLCVYYSPSSRVDYFNSLDSLLALHTPCYEYAIIVGDFNTCLLKSDSRADKLRTLLTFLNLTILPLTATHNAPNCTPSLLDLLITSSPDLIAAHGQFPSNVSYHDLIFLSFNIKPPRRKHKFMLLRSFKGIDLGALHHDLSAVDWSPIYSAINLDHKIGLFNNTLIKLFDIHAPLRKIKVRHVPAPWLTQEIISFMAKRDRAKCRYRNRPTDENLARFKYLRNRCSRLCRDAKRRHIHSSISHRDPSQVWKFLRTFGIGKSSFLSDSLPKGVDLNALNTHFSLPPVTVDPVTKAHTISRLSSLSLPSCSPFFFNTVTEVDVIKHINAISSTAVGNDNISSRMISLCLPGILPILSHIFNHSLSTNTFPTAWKCAEIIPFPKISNPSSPSQFRPISILPFLSKVLEHIVHKQLSHFLSTNNLLSPFQSGFRPGHSTVTALLKVTDDLRLAMENKNVSILVLLDFSSAFNSVDFEIFLSVLLTLNISSSAIDWFSAYLRGRSQRVRSDESVSDWCDLVAGVPQGGVLSPLLFSVFINTISSVITSHFHLYADDLQLYRHTHIDDLHSTVADLNSDLHRIALWAKSYGLLVNPSKSQAIIIGSKYMVQRIDMSNVPRIMYDNTPINYSDTVKNLGVIVDRNLTWNYQINEVSKKIHFKLHTLRSLQNFLPLTTKISLVQALIFPILDYADSCYLDLTEELLNKLERLQNLGIRFIFGLKKYDHISAFRQRLEWLPIRLRRNTHILSLLYKILYNPFSPSYLIDRFNFSRAPNIPCRSNLRSILSIPSHRTNFYSYSFTVHAVRLWNSLPHTVRDSPTVNLFKGRLREHYLKLDST